MILEGFGELFLVVAYKGGGVVIGSPTWRSGYRVSFTRRRSQVQSL
jgi:hypothetical protein